MKKIKTEADLRAAQEQADALCYTDNQGIFYFLNYGAFFPAVREILISMPRICEQAHPHIHLAISGPRKGREFMRFIDNLAAYLQEATGDVNDPAPTFFVIPETDQFFVLHILRNRPDLFGYTAVKDKETVTNAIRQKCTHEALVPVMMAVPKIIPASDVMLFECQARWDEINELFDPYHVPEGEA